MPPICSVCRSPDRTEIDRSLVSGTASIRDIAGRHMQHGRSSIERHGRNCLRLTAPADRLHGLAARAELAAVAASAVERATELLDREEARGSGRGTVAALGALSRTLGAAERLFPADDGFGDDEVRALILTVAEDVADPAARKVITTGLRDRGADALAAALDQVWARRPPVLDVDQRKELIA